MSRSVTGTRMRPIAWGRISNPFAARGSYASNADSHGPRGHHTGVDFGKVLVPVIKNIDGLPVRATVTGTVVISESSSWAGEWVGIYYAPDDVTVTYWHMRAGSRRFKVGDFVEMGQMIGKVGSTGNSTAPHLHVQVNHGRSFVYHNHINPTPWCRGNRWWPTQAEQRLAQAEQRRAQRKKERRADRASRRAGGGAR